MRSLLISVLALFTSASAMAFPMQTYFTWNPTVVTAQVYNPYYAPIACIVRVYGVLGNGLTQVYNIPTGWIASGAEQSVYQTATYGYFVGANAAADCYYY